MKKGYTLIEIVISIVIVVVIGTASSFAINLISKTKNAKTLQDMSSDILTAVNLYIETHSETKKQIYENKNGAIVLLEALEQEGLIDFGNLNIENEYVVTMLSTESNCSSPEFITSWNFPDDKVLYICASNNVTHIDNLTNKTEYVARGINPNNYVKIEYNTYETTWRIVEIVNQDIKLMTIESKNFILTSTGFPTTLEYLPNKFLQESYYGSQSSNRGEENNLDIYSFETSETKRYIGYIDYLSILNANASDGNWIYNILYNFALEKDSEVDIGYNGCIEYQYNSMLDTESAYFSNGYLDVDCTSESGYYAPLITLNDCTELKIDTSCSSSFEVGSESCPYLVDGSKC